MTVKTRYFVIVSLLVVGVGLGTGWWPITWDFQPARSWLVGAPKNCAICLHCGNRGVRGRPGSDGV